ncbi:hypothetical protein [Methylobacterium nigriterrae]|uniref:hypothetical protein n=1 Tax=Methylobacterium nigriterrae TaxID=3127512 RepID=UPI00301409D1
MQWDVTRTDAGPDIETGKLMYLVSARTDQFAEWLSITVTIEDTGDEASNQMRALDRAAETASTFAQAVRAQLSEA